MSEAAARGCGDGGGGEVRARGGEWFRLVRRGNMGPFWAHFCMLSLLEIITKSTEFLASRGVEGARLNAEQLVGHALGLKRMQIYLQFERLLSAAELEKIRPLVRRRANREPLQHILGEVEWGGVRLKCDRRALVPRPETESLLELVLERRPAAVPARVLDLGTGTGALALGVAAAWPEARVVAVDASEDALALARENAAVNGLEGRVEFIRSNWFEALPAGGERFDVIVSNPPYLTEAEAAEAEPEVRAHDPMGALVAGDEGCADLLAIIAAARERLVEGGWLALETGVAQHERLLAACAEAGLRDGESRRDLTGRDRFVLARR